MHTPLLKTNMQQKGNLYLIFFLGVTKCGLCDKTENHTRGAVGCIAVQVCFIGAVDGCARLVLCTEGICRKTSGGWPYMLVCRESPIPRTSEWVTDNSYCFPLHWHVTVSLICIRLFLSLFLGALHNERGYVTKVKTVGHAHSWCNCIDSFEVTRDKFGSLGNATACFLSYVH